MKCCQPTAQFSVVVRLVAAMINTLTVCLWGVWGLAAMPPYTTSTGTLLFVHAIAGCLFVLPALVLAETLGETLGPWTLRVFLVMALVLFLPLGGFGIYFSVRSGTAMQASVATLCLAVGLLMLLDFSHVEKLYCWHRTES